MEASTSQAQARWEVENKVQRENDSLLRFDEADHQAVQAKAPWKDDPRHYTKVKVSALALLKMVMHARSGGRIEVMGMLQGKVMDDTFVIVDTFALPVEGTETRVNAAEGAYPYMITYMQNSQRVGRKENIVGWYHSHPGYGCWLSGIDVGTQRSGQQGQEPWLAIVVDPMRTMSAGKVEIGAFRTYPPGYTPPGAEASEYQPIPLDKIEDFGSHANDYYSLDVSIFKTSLDTNIINLLWNKYWVNTLAASPLLSNKAFIGGQLSDVTQKLEKAGSWLEMHRGPRTLTTKGDNELQKVVKDAAKVAEEQLKGLSSQAVKHALFNRALQGCGCGAQHQSQQQEQQVPPAHAQPPS